MTAAMICQVVVDVWLLSFLRFAHVLPVVAVLFFFFFTNISC